MQKNPNRSPALRAKDIYYMTAQVQPNQAQNPTESANNSKEINFRQQEKALRDKYERELAVERQAREQAEKTLQESRNRQVNDEDDDSEPYVDHKRLKKEQAKFGQQIKETTSNQINEAVHHALKEERKQNWLKTNPDFYDVLQHAEKFAQTDPELAETILEMPEGFERQKLVYKNIKALGLHRPQLKEPSIQEKIDSNRRSPFYQPSNVGTAPYAPTGDFSAAGQKDAYAKMQALKAQLRI